MKLDSKLRKRIKHPLDLTMSELQVLFSNRYFEGTLTEKTDGIAFEVGIDTNGMYTRNGRSCRIYHPDDYLVDAIQRLGSDRAIPNAKFYQDLGWAHELLVTDLRDRIRSTGVAITGELFFRKFGSVSDDNKWIRFVVVPYDNNAIGDIGTFVIHSQLSKPFTDDDSVITIDDDVIEDNQFSIDISDLSDRFKQLPLHVLTSRRKADGRLKRDVNQEIFTLKLHLRGRMNNRVKQLTSKWGPISEGFVFHNHDVRLKIVTDYFKQNKALEMFSGR